ncbi:hypothetical protein ACQPYE_10795 [Actinosynnema sp. CA-299493]
MTLLGKIASATGVVAMSLGLSVFAVPPAGAASCPDNGWWVLDGLLLHNGANGTC